MSHTPGPWLITPDFKTAVNAGRKHVAMVNFNSTTDAEKRVAGEEHEANARLIAAAPDMFEALQGLVSFFDKTGFTTEFLSDARSALSKAQGTTPEVSCRRAAFSELRDDPGAAAVGEGVSASSPASDNGEATI